MAKSTGSINSVRGLALEIFRVAENKEIALGSEICLRDIDIGERWRVPNHHLGDVIGRVRERRFDLIDHHNRGYQEVVVETSLDRFRPTYDPDSVEMAFGGVQVMAKNLSIEWKLRIEPIEDRQFYPLSAEYQLLLHNLRAFSFWDVESMLQWSSQEFAEAAVFVDWLLSDRPGAVLVCPYHLLQSCRHELFVNERSLGWIDCDLGARTVEIRNRLVELMAADRFELGVKAHHTEEDTLILNSPAPWALMALGTAASQLRA